MSLVKPRPEAAIATDASPHDEAQNRRILGLE